MTDTTAAKTIRRTVTVCYALLVLKINIQEECIIKASIFIYM